MRIAIFDDPIEIDSPGLLVPGLTIEDLWLGVSKLRNHVIGRVFHELDMIEKWGSGIRRMGAECEQADLPVLPSTTPQPGDKKNTAPLANGSRFGASVAAHGERLATARIQLEEKVVDPSRVFNRPTTMRRYFPQLAADRQTRPPVDELTMSLTDNLALVDVWAGPAELRIPEVQGEDMHLIAPLRVGRGYRLGMAYSVTDLRILKSYAGS